jgi:hypothetical protein
MYWTRSRSYALTPPAEDQPWTPETRHPIMILRHSRKKWSQLMRPALLGTLVTLAIAFPSGSCLVAQRVPSTVTQDAITPADLRSRLFIIAHDSMMGREPGGGGDYRTAEYVASEFQRLGLRPAGENGTYYQTVPFVRVEADPQSHIVVDRTTLTFGRDLLLMPPATKTLTIDNAPSVYMGAVSDTTQLMSPADAAGRVLVFDGARSADGTRSTRGLPGAVRSPRFAPAALIVVAVIDLLAPEQRARIIAGRLTVDTARVSGMPPLVFVTPAAAAVIVGGDLNSLRRGSQGKSVSARIAFVNTAMEYPARNVIAVLTGRDARLKRQYVALTAHNDHVGYDHAPMDHDSLRAFNRVVRPMGADSPLRPATPAEKVTIRALIDSLHAAHPPRLDSIRNGADDDGSGTVSILEIAERLVTMQKPRRSILFVSHTGEEAGLVGSAWFTDHPTVPLDSIIGEIDQDMVGRGTAQDLPEGGAGYLEVVGARRLSRAFGDALEAANAAQPRPFTFNYTFDAPGHPLQYYCRADHYNYARYSIPAVAFSRGEHLDYHQITDEAQYIDYDDLARVSNLVLDAALRLANADWRPKLDAPKKDPHAQCRQ